MKYDGLSISLIYEDGILVKAVTRGDGVQGDDVTANVKMIKTIPQKVSEKRSFEIRGEVLLPFREFERLNEEKEKRGEPLFANPRNAASGTLKQQDSRIVAQRGLDAYLYYLLGETMPTDGHLENLHEAEKWGFQISKGMKKAVKELGRQGLEILIKK